MSTGTPSATNPPAGTTPAPSPPPPEFLVNASAAATLTALWVVPLVLFAALGLFWKPYAYQTYMTVRSYTFGAVVFLAAAGIWRAWKYIGGSKTAEPWYTDSFLVALVIFWAVAPPTWFFLEYYMFDADAIALPTGATKDAFLKDTKTYSDLASKVWAAMGASLGGAIAAARK